ncbi:hypothetical protein [Halobacillus sp. K22]|uniref:hypothetical protein n=1 Tax=Halobacillus sp. K22 TaxID=3457431 RepID=UPI003FCDC0FD
MKIRFFLLIVFTVFITGCELQEDQIYSLSSLLEEKKPIGTIEIREDKYTISANEEAETSEQNKIAEFESLISDIKLKRVKQSNVNELTRKYASDGNIMTISVANSANRKNVLFMDLSSEGKGIVVSFENGGSTDEVYKVHNGRPALYKEIYDFYESIY